MIFYQNLAAKTISFIWFLRQDGLVIKWQLPRSTKIITSRSSRRRYTLRLNSLGAMEPDIADRLIKSTDADLDSRAEWGRAQRFFYGALRAVSSRLPIVVQQQLDSRGPDLPPAADLEAARVALWRSIEADQMGNTPEGAAVRAALFAFFPPDEDGPLDAVAFFCTFFTRAALPEPALTSAFHDQWPQNGA